MEKLNKIAEAIQEIIANEAKNQANTIWHRCWNDAGTRINNDIKDLRDDAKQDAEVINALIKRVAALEGQIICGEEGDKIRELIQEVRSEIFALMRAEKAINEARMRQLELLIDSMLRVSFVAVAGALVGIAVYFWNL